MHALRELRDPQPVNRVNRHLQWARASHAAMHDGIRAAAGRVALMEFSLRPEHLLALASDEAEPFLRVLPDELSTWDELGDLVETKAGMIAFEELTALPYAEAVREVVRVYRGGVDGVLAPEGPAGALPEGSSESAPTGAAVGDASAGERRE